MTVNVKYGAQKHEAGKKEVKIMGMARMNKNKRGMNGINTMDKKAERGITRTTRKKAKISANEN